MRYFRVESSKLSVESSVARLEQDCKWPTQRLAVSVRAVSHQAYRQLIALPLYISDKAMSQFGGCDEGSGLTVLKMGDPRNTTEGTEQDRKCCDNSGDFFVRYLRVVSSHSDMPFHKLGVGLSSPICTPRSR